MLSMHVISKVNEISSKSPGDYKFSYFLLDSQNADIRVDDFDLCVMFSIKFTVDWLRKRLR